jgi:hypothetical protein
MTMGNTLMSLLVKLGVDASDYARELADAEGKANKTGSNIASGLASIGGGIVVGGIAAVGAAAAGMTTFLAGSTQAAMEFQEAQAQLAAVLESTGGAAGLTVDQLNAMSSEYQSLTRYNDEAITGAQSLLLTFTQVGKEVFPDATMAILDMSTAMKMDLKSSTQLVGKALNDPIQGMAALRRVGVQLTDAQEEQIKTFMELGDVASAQKVIIGELETQFGGSAAAAAGTFAGRLDQMRNTFGDLQEAVGLRLMPAITAMLDKMMEWVNTPETQEFIDNLIDGVVNLATSFLEWLPGAFDTMIGFVGWLSENKGVVIGVLAAMGVAVLAFGVKVAIAAWTAMVPLLPVIAIMLAIAAVVALVYTAWTQNWGGIQDKAKAVWAFLEPIFNAIRDWLAVNIPIAIEFLTKAFKAISAWLTGTLFPILKQVAEWFGDKIAPAIDFVSRAIQTAIGWFKSLADSIKNLKLPDWLTPGSPTPLELGLRGINAEMRKASMAVLPGFSAELAMSSVPSTGGRGSSDEIMLLRQIAAKPEMDTRELAMHIRDALLQGR